MCEARGIVVSHTLDFAYLSRSHSPFPWENKDTVPARYRQTKKVIYDHKNLNNIHKTNKNNRLISDIRTIFNFFWDL